MLTLNLNILWTVVNILVLFVLLRKFLYRPVMNVIEQRQKQIDDAIADAEGKKNDAQAVLAQAQDKLQNVDTEAAQRREAYEKQAEKEKEQLLQDAQRQADAIVAEGKAAAEAEHARRLRDANAETSALARDMCEKLLARNLTQQDDARLLDDLLQKAGDINISNRIININKTCLLIIFINTEICDYLAKIALRISCCTVIFSIYCSKSVTHFVKEIVT